MTNNNWKQKDTCKIHNIMLIASDKIRISHNMTKKCVKYTKQKQ